jgi:hypothetical protein
MGRNDAAFTRSQEKCASQSILRSGANGNSACRKRWWPDKFHPEMQRLRDCLMSKRELIDCICQINRSAKPQFLAQFSEEQLDEYLEHLLELDLNELALCA